MPMEKHKCKLCSRSFINGRALGGHMKSHFSTFLLPSKPPLQLPHRNFSPLISSSSDESEREEVAGTEEHEEGATALIYEPRQIPKKSFKLADPIVLDRGSETESKGPTRRRSKRKRKVENWEELYKSSLRKPIAGGFPAEPEPACSVSDTSPEESIARSLILLSRDKWIKKEEEKEEPSREIKSKRVEGKNSCKKCMKAFRSSRALWSHKKICSENETELKNGGNGRIFECPFCFKVFGSGQALGGHKRSHLMSSANSTVNAANSGKTGLSFIDLNLPAPTEEDNYSVVSDA